MISQLSIPTIDPLTDEREEHVCYGTYPDGLHTIIHAALTYDRSMRMHLLSVNKMAHVWAEQLRLSNEERELFVTAALLHDVGKILLPIPIVLKPSRLTTDEYAVIKQHVKLGERLIRTEPDFEDVALLVGQHHEWFDGSGYPNGLTGEQLHPLSRALSVVDAFSAMRDERPYHTRPMTDAEALRELENCAGTQFDPFYVESFVRMKRSRKARIA